MLLFVLPIGVVQSADKLRFNRDIRAVLTDKCFACHGPDAQTVEGGLRLDLREEAVAAEAIVPKDPEASEIVSRIFSTDEDSIMPPPSAHKPLSEEERELLKQWIAEGAEYEPHWAYTPLQAERPEDETPTQAIDRFIDQRLRAEQVQAAKPADRVTLIRRLSFDLNGLPPTANEVAAFVNDQSDDAYEKLVDRLLNSKRYGERMAIHWLDLVRYADTVGYHGDQNVSQSPYRDYIIHAFNDNMPFDRFVREQLAGDLLPNATLDQRVASGYNRLNQTTEEGGSQAKEYLAIYFADRVRNVSQVFMGATVGCAQCHDHKYDPYTARDFYSLGAFFADLEERGVYGGRNREPTIPVPSNVLLEEITAAEAQVDKLNAGVQTLQKELVSQQPQWETQAVKQIDETKEVEAVWVDDSKIKGAGNDWKFVTAPKAPVHSGSKSRLQKSNGLIQHLFQGTDEKVKVTDETRFYAWVHLDKKNPPKAIMLQFNDGSWSHRSVWGSDDITYGRQPKSYAAYQRAGELPKLNEWVRLEVKAQDVGLEPGSEVNGMAFTQFGGLAHWDKAGWIANEGMPAAVAEALVISVDQRTETQAKAVRDHFIATSPQMIKMNSLVAAAKKEVQRLKDSATRTVVSKSVKPREIRILPRGNWMDDSGEVVQPAIPTFLGEIESEQRPTRLDLAKWLCEPDNPLTSRTLANRIWSLLFGRGICASVDDFGGQGTYPSYPDLLDYLSIELVQSGWDIKHLVRTIVLSDAYRRESKPTEQLQEMDPYNDLFARQGRFRIDAEMVRDAALLASGLLVEQVGGESVRPYQPAGYYAQLNFPKRKYAADDGANQYRRGLYTHWQRTFLHPMLKAFDAPSREECTAARSRSNTPLQALALLNDPTFVEAARVFAERIMSAGGSDVEARVDWAYRTMVSRPPDSLIHQELANVFDEQLKHYREHTDDAKQLLSVGNAATNEKLDPAELAAWTAVARIVMNLHESIMRY